MKTKRSKKRNDKTAGNWQYINGSGWAHLLAHRPQFADKCDWSKLDGEDWANLLISQPGFAEKCDWSKLEGWHWVRLIGKCAEFADKCVWSKLNGGDWLDLLEVRPEFIDRCDWSTFRGEDIMRLVCQSIGGRTPSLLSRLDDCDLSRLSAHEWPYILALCPELADRFEAVRRDWSQDRVCDGKFDDLDLGGERQLPLD